MKERPILFSAPMIRALLAGTKTQTRREVKPQPTHFVGGPGVIDSHGKPVPRAPAIEDGVSSREIVCPYGEPGDRLWVREAWRAPLAYELTPPRNIPSGTPIAYQADGAGTVPHLNVGKLRPGMFMPRWASRITLEITDVRVERLKGISEANAAAEGIEKLPDGEAGPPCWRDYLHPGAWTDNPVQSYFSLWESINGAGSWDTNPWVWVLSVGRV